MLKSSIVFSLLLSVTAFAQTDDQKYNEYLKYNGFSNENLESTKASSQKKPAFDRSYEEYKKNMDTFVKKSPRGKVKVESTGAVVLDGNDGITCLNCFSKTTLEQQPQIKEWAERYGKEMTQVSGSGDSPSTKPEQSYEEFKIKMDTFVESSPHGTIKVQSTGAVVLDGHEGSTCLNCFSKDALEKQPLLKEWAKRYGKERGTRIVEHAQPLAGCSLSHDQTKIDCPELGRTYVWTPSTFDDLRKLGKDIEQKDSTGVKNPKESAPHSKGY